MNDPFEKYLSGIEQMLIREEQRGPVEKLEDLYARHKAISRIKTHISEARRTLTKRRHRYLAEYEQQLDSLHSRLQYLSKLPRYRDVTWARNVLHLQDLLIVVLDLDDHPRVHDLIRILAIDRTGKVHFDRFIKPRVPPSEHVSYTTGVTPQDVAEASSIEDIWADLLCALSGRFILTSDLDDFQELLEGYARLNALEWPVLLGESLAYEIEQYFSISLDLTSLDQLCCWLGQPLPLHPQQTARDRANGYLHVLQAMAQGVIILQAREIENERDDDEEIWNDEEWDDERRFYEGQQWGDDDDDEQ
jgi:hypothetical protein